MTLFPLMRLSGHSRSQETKWFSVSHLLISQPASLMTVIAVITSMLSILVLLMLWTFWFVVAH
jgi:hypothetical protein